MRDIELLRIPPLHLTEVPWYRRVLAGMRPRVVRRHRQAVTIPAIEGELPRVIGRLAKVRKDVHVRHLRILRKVRPTRLHRSRSNRCEVVIPRKTQIQTVATSANVSDR